MIILAFFCLPVILLTPVLLLMVWLAPREWIAIGVISVPILELCWLNFINGYSERKGIWDKVFEKYSARGQGQ